mgnify:CR=1 FL=1
MGFYLTEHPLTPVLAKINTFRTHRLEELNRDEHHGQKVKIAGVVSDLRTVITRKNAQEMAFAQIEDETGNLEVVVFPRIFAQTRNCWVKDRIVVIDGRVEYRQEKLSILVEKASTLEDLKKKKVKKGKTQSTFDIEVKIPARISPRKLVELNKLLKQNQGQDRIVLVFVDSLGQEKRILLSFGVDYSKKVVQEIEKLIAS